MLSVGLSKENEKPHFSFRKIKNFMPVYNLLCENTFIIKKDLE